MSRDARLLLFFAALNVASALWAAPCAAVSVALERRPPSVVRSVVHFSAAVTGTGPVSITWDFGDGTRIGPSEASEASHVYESPGHYPVIVIARDDSGVRSDSFIFTVHNPLAAAQPTASSTIVVDPQQGRVCTANPDHHSVTCLDAQNLERIFSVNVGGEPKALAFGPGGNLWVSVDEPATVCVVEPSGALIDTVSLGYGAHPSGIAPTPDGTRILAALAGTGELAVIDTSTRSELARVEVGQSPSGVAVNGDGKRAFVSRFISGEQTGEVYEVDLEALTLATTLHLEAGEGPDTEATARGVPNYVKGVAVSPDGRSLWAASKQDNTFRGAARDGLALTFETTVRTILSRVDLETGLEARDERVDLNNRSMGLALTTSPLGDYVFVALLGNNGITVLDAYDRRIAGGRSELGLAPDGVALGEDGRLYVHSFMSRTVHVVDASGVLSGEDFSLPVVGDASTVDAEVLEDDVLLGKQIFYNAADERMARHGYVSCAGCHLGGFEDGRVWDFTDRGEGFRNTTSLLGRRGMGHGPVHWSANFDEIQDFEHDIRNAFGGTGFLTEAQFNEGTRAEPLGDPKAGVSPELDALAAYVASLDHVPESPFRDPDGTLTERGWRGHALFVETGCDDCHAGADFTDSKERVRYDVGSLRETSGGRLGAMLDGIDTPTLRGAWQTAPYLHDGSARTLAEAIFLPGDLHGETETLSESERADLVAYVQQIDNTAHADEAELPPPADAGAPITMPDASPAAPLPEAAPEAVAAPPGGGCASAPAGQPASPATALWGVGMLLVLTAERRRGRRHRVDPPAPPAVRRT